MFVNTYQPGNLAIGIGWLRNHPNVTCTIRVKSYNEPTQHGYQTCHIIVWYMQSIQYGYCTLSNGISIMYQLICLTRSNYNIPLDSYNLLNGTQLYENPWLLYYYQPLKYRPPRPTMPTILTSDNNGVSTWPRREPKPLGDDKIHLIIHPLPLETNGHWRIVRVTDCWDNPPPDSEDSSGDTAYTHRPNPAAQHTKEITYHFLNTVQ